MDPPKPPPGTFSTVVPYLRVREETEGIKNGIAAPSHARTPDAEMILGLQKGVTNWFRLFYLTLTAHPELFGNLTRGR